MDRPKNVNLSEYNLKTQKMVNNGNSLLGRYQDLVVGRHSLGGLLYYEWCMMLSHLSGALGLFLRKIFWPRLFGSCGRDVFFGRDIIIRHPNRIHLGSRVVISDGCILEARHTEQAQALILEDDVILSNGVMISGKEGFIKVGARTGIGARTVIHSAINNPVVIGADVIIGPMCYLVGGGNYTFDRPDVLISQQEIKAEDGVTLENNVWLGAKVAVLGGVTIGTGSIGAAGSVITKSVPSGAVCSGMPAKVLKMRPNWPDQTPTSVKEKTDGR